MCPIWKTFVYIGAKLVPRGSVTTIYSKMAPCFCCLVTLDITPNPWIYPCFLPPDLGEFSLPGWFLVCFLCGGSRGHLGVMRSSQVGRCFCIGTIAHRGGVFQWGKGMKKWGWWWWMGWVVATRMCFFGGKVECRRLIDLFIYIYMWCDVCLYMCICRCSCIFTYIYFMFLFMHLKYWSNFNWTHPIKNLQILVCFGIAKHHQYVSTLSFSMSCNKFKVSECITIVDAATCTSWLGAGFYSHPLVDMFQSTSCLRPAKGRNKKF